MKLPHKLILLAVALAALTFATPAQARWYHHRHFVGGFYYGGYPYYSNYGPAYNGPYYGYYGPYWGGGYTYGFGGHGGYYHHGHGGYRGGGHGHGRR